MWNRAPDPSALGTSIIMLDPSALGTSIIMLESGAVSGGFGDRRDGLRPVGGDGDRGSGGQGIAGQVVRGSQVRRSGDRRSGGQAVRRSGGQAVRRSGGSGVTGQRKAGGRLSVLRRLVGLGVGLSACSAVRLVVGSRSHDVIGLGQVIRCSVDFGGRAGEEEFPSLGRSKFSGLRVAGCFPRQAALLFAGVCFH